MFWYIIFVFLINFMYMLPIFLRFGIFVMYYLLDKLCCLVVDVFRKFLDKSGNFKESLTNDIWGMWSLYEASSLGTEDEQILKKAMEFSRARLNELIPHLSPDVGRKIAKSLTLPKYLRMERLEARNYMEEYSQESNQIPTLLELAKLDSEMIQSLHQRELVEICR